MAAAILRTRCLTSELTPGRPDHLRLESHDQKSRKARRCQDTTVSGFTMIKAPRQFFQVIESHIQNRRSPFRSRGRGQCRLYTASCWRRARFSKAISPRLPGKMRRRISEQNSVNMGSRMRGRPWQSQILWSDAVLARHRLIPSLASRPRCVFVKAACGKTVRAV